MIALFVVGFVVVVFVCGIVAGLSVGSGSVNTHSSDDIVHEMRMQRARDYFNNPVVNELKREAFFRDKH